MNNKSDEDSDKDDDDDDDKDEEMATDEDSDEDDDDDEEEEDGEVDEELRRSVKAALGSAAVASDEEDEVMSVDSSVMFFSRIQLDTSSFLLAQSGAKSHISFQRNEILLLPPPPSSDLFPGTSSDELKIYVFFPSDWWLGRGVGGVVVVKK